MSDALSGHDVIEYMEFAYVEGGNFGSAMEELPRDAMNAILSFLFLDEYDILSLASKRMNHAVSESEYLFMSDSPLGRLHSARESFVGNPRLRAVPESHLDEEGLRKLLCRFRSLNVLHLHGLAGVGDRLFAILNESSAASTLTQLSLHGCCLSYWCPTSLEIRNLSHVSISGGSIRSAFGSFTSSSNLKSLAIGQCSSLRDEHVTDMVQRLRKKLQNLSFHQCLRVKKPLLQFECLETLNLMGCFALTNLPHFSCPTLRQLSLSFCFCLPGSVIQDIVNSLKCLQHLVLVKCPRLETLMIHSSTLQSLNVSLSNNLRSLELMCEDLSAIESVSCSSLTNVSLETKLLTELNLSLLPVEGLYLKAPALTELKLSGCNNLHEQKCYIQCPNLSSLDICGTNLTANTFGKEIMKVKQGVTTLALPF